MAKKFETTATKKTNKGLNPWAIPTGIPPLNSDTGNMLNPITLNKLIFPLERQSSLL